MQIEELQENIVKLKEKYAGDFKRLKYIEAFERSIPYMPVIRTLEAYNELTSGLENWINNPLSDEELEMHGFAGLLVTIKEYDSDTFSSEGSKITDQEILQIADLIIDEWVGHYLDGVLISELLERVREDKQPEKVIEE